MKNVICEKKEKSNSFGKSTLLDSKFVCKILFFCLFFPYPGKKISKVQSFWPPSALQKWKRYLKPIRKTIKRCFPSNWMVNYIFSSFSLFLGRFLFLGCWKCSKTTQFYGFLTKNEQKKWHSFAGFRDFFDARKVKNTKRFDFIFFSKFSFPPLYSCFSCQNNLISEN